MAEHGAIEENTVAAIKVEELVSVKQIMTVKNKAQSILIELAEIESGTGKHNQEVKNCES